MVKSTKNSWKVEFKNKSVEAEYIQNYREGKISADDNKLILKWISIIESEGPEAIQHIKFW